MQREVDLPEETLKLHQVPREENKAQRRNCCPPWPYSSHLEVILSKSGSPTHIPYATLELLASLLC